MYSTAPKRTWREVGSKRVCDVSAGETYLSKSPGKVSNLEECKKTCEDASGCQSITYFKSGWCSHFGTACTKTKKNSKAVIALRLVPNKRNLRGSPWQFKFTCSFHLFIFGNYDPIVHDHKLNRQPLTRWDIWDIVSSVYQENYIISFPNYDQSMIQLYLFYVKFYIQWLKGFLKVLMLIKKK